MSRKLVVCEVLAHELESCGLTRDSVILVEQGLHRHPGSLRAELQRIVDAQPAGDTIALAYGLCGNGLLGLKAGEHSLVVPRVDDCIGLLLGSREAHRQSLQTEPGTYFLSRGWIDFGADPWIEYERASTRYGRERALTLVRSMMQNYRRLAVIDTGVPLLEEHMTRAKQMASLFDLRVEIVPGSLALIRRLLSFDHEGDEFTIIPPGGEVLLDYYLGAQSGAGLAGGAQAHS